MKKKFIHICLALIISSCSFFNEKYVMLPIKSNPTGADIYIDGRHYGQTPMAVQLIPDRDYAATVTKQGYGTSSFSLETFRSVRENRGGKDMVRCVADALGTMLVIPAAGFLSVHCKDFKQKEYFVNIDGNQATFDPHSTIDPRALRRDGQDLRSNNGQNQGNGLNYHGQEEDPYGY